MPVRALPVLAAMALAASGAVAEGPYRPNRADQVLEQLQLPRLAGAASLLELRNRWTAQPAHVPSALAYARAALELNRREEDPRYLGYAQVALGTWWNQPGAPPEVLLLRAAVQLARHDIAAAERDLQALIDSPAPEGHMARITRAGLRLSQGEPVAALADCNAAKLHTSALVGLTCSAAAQGLQGDAANALQRLEAALLDAADAPLATELWSRGVAAELAQRLGRSAQARSHFDHALRRMAASASPDPGLLAACADFLLAQGEARQVQALLLAYPRHDSLVLRLALARQLLGHAGDTAAAAAAKAHSRHLALRFEEMRQRGDLSHLREQALFALELQGNAQAALRVIGQAWTLQREPVDARITLRAARLAAQPGAAAPVLAWLRQTGLQDVRLAFELAQLPTQGARQ